MYNVAPPSVVGRQSVLEIICTSSINYAVSVGFLVSFGHDSGRTDVGFDEEAFVAGRIYMVVAAIWLSAFSLPGFGRVVRPLPSNRYANPIRTAPWTTMLNEAINHVQRTDGGCPRRGKGLINGRSV